MPDPATPEWFAQVVEEPIDPEVEIVDPHHHLWPEDRGYYYVDELAGDTMAGHRVTQTVFIECNAAYRDRGPEHLRCVGETEFVAEAAAELQRRYPAAPPIAAIVGHADFLHPGFGETLDAHIEAGQGLFRGVRGKLANADEPGMFIPPHARTTPEGTSADPAYRASVQSLGERGLTYDTWVYHFQNAEVAALARACPDTQFVADHLGGPLGVGHYAGREDEIFNEWRVGFAELAECDNVVVKLGGMAMPDSGFGWWQAARPPTSDEYLAATGRYYEFAIERFGPDRCMFESNYPVDKFSIDYVVLWNAFKKLAADYSPDEQMAMLAGTARRIYSL